MTTLDSKQAELRELERQKDTHRSHINKIVANQEGLRSNIKSLEKVSNTTLVDRYIRDLDSQEDDLIATQSLMDQLAEDMAERLAGVKQLKLETASAATKLRQDLPGGANGSLAFSERERVETGLKMAATA